MKSHSIANGGVSQTLLLAAYRYMDYWLPLVLFCSFPLWILPAAVVYLVYKALGFVRLALRKGQELVKADPSPPL